VAQGIRLEDLDDSTFDPYVADDDMFGDADDPYKILHELRAQGPVVRGNLSALIGMPSAPLRGYDDEYTVLSHGGVGQVLSDPVTFSSRPLAELLSNYGPLLTGMDPPEHAGYRKVFQRVFRPAVVQGWATEIVGPVIEEHVSNFDDRVEAELLQSFVRPYPFRVIFRLLALPTEDVETFYRLTMAQICTAYAAEASTKLARYFGQLLAERRAVPGDDLISGLATVEADGEPVPEEVLVSFLLQLMSAGGETTFRSTSALLTGLLNHPDQLAAVRDDRELVAQTVEEALRWEGPVIRGARATTSDTIVDGVPVPVNSLVNASYGAANRDPSVFSQPDSFDIFRERHRHFGFAAGAHNCLGQALARLEMSQALNALLDRFPKLRVDPSYPPPRLRGASMRTPRQIHVLLS
jgi:cytochrome P450